MSSLHALSFLSIPPEILVALDNRGFRFALQPFHHLVRLTHILSVSGFFGAICLLDLRLTGLRTLSPLKAVSQTVLPWVYATFAIALASGLMLFFYDPVHVGSHAYFTPKMILIVLGMANAALFNSRGFAHALAATGPMPLRARVFGAVSLTAWLGVMVCAALNDEAAPKVLLR